MCSYDCLLAAVLLTTSVDSAELLPHLELIQPAFLQLALDAEILDCHEEHLLKGMSQDLAGDYLALRSRFDALLSAPKVAEGERFPERKMIEDFLTFNRAFRKELQESLEQNSAQTEELETALREVDRLHLLWSTVRDIRCQFYYVTVRRQSLQQLRDMVGAEAFYRGQLPPHVPLWCLPRLR